jgi:hypothetical protein
VVAAAEGEDPALSALSSGRLTPATSGALNRLEQRFQGATDSLPVRQASLPMPAPAGQ